MSDIKVKRFYSYPHFAGQPKPPKLNPGQVHLGPLIESQCLSFDYESADNDVLVQFNDWKKKNRVKIISMQAPSHQQLPPENGHCGGPVVELAVLYKML